MAVLLFMNESQLVWFGPVPAMLTPRLVESEKTPPPTGTVGAGHVTRARDWKPAGLGEGSPVATVRPLRLPQIATAVTVASSVLALFSSTRQPAPIGNVLFMLTE